MQEAIEIYTGSAAEVQTKVNAYLGSHPKAVILKHAVTTIPGSGEPAKKPTKAELKANEERLAALSDDERAAELAATPDDAAGNGDTVIVSTIVGLQL